jgi:hypothetical protein
MASHQAIRGYSQKYVDESYWLRAANERSSISQILPRVQALQEKHRSSDRVSTAQSVPAIQFSTDHQKLHGNANSWPTGAAIQAGHISVDPKG